MKRRKQADKPHKPFPLDPEGPAAVEPSPPGYRADEPDTDLGAAHGGASGPGSAEPNWTGSSSGGATAGPGTGGVTTFPTRPPFDAPDKPRK